MILGKPTLQTVLEIIQEEGCPVCGEVPAGIQVDGPDRILPSCGHVIDVRDWIVSHYENRDFDLSDLHEPE